MSFISVVEQFNKIVRESPDKVIFTYYSSVKGAPSTLTSSELFLRATEIAGYLQNDKEIKPGETVVLNYTPGLEFVEAFVACLISGIIPAPISPPTVMGSDRNFPNFLKIVRDSQCRYLLTNKTFGSSDKATRISKIMSSTEELEKIKWIETDEVRSESFVSREFHPQDLAFLQYTSGSTSSPKGVMISHQNLTEHTHLLKHEFNMRKNGVTVSWMPHYHDFALIGGVVDAMVGNNEYVFTSPMNFMRRPGFWVEMMHKHSATLTAAPDYGYRVLVERTNESERRAWDLSQLECAIVAAEPVRSSTLDDFSEAFAVSKFDSAAFSPCYGLAEHVIAVTVNGKGRYNRDELGLSSSDLEDSKSAYVGCGYPAIGVDIKFVDPVSLKEVPKGQAGEVWVHSKNKALGYFNRLELTQEKFKAKLKNDSREWLRTGDFAMEHDGELVFLSRVDDQINIKGQNIFPQDAEELAMKSSEKIRSGRVLCFDLPLKYSYGTQTDGSGKEVIGNTKEVIGNTLGIVLELSAVNVDDSQYKEISNAVRRRIGSELGISDPRVIFVKKGSIPRTTSGKLQRKKCRELWLANKMNSLFIENGMNINL